MRKKTSFHKHREKAEVKKKAVLAYEKAAEILLRCEEEIDRPEFLSLVQIHHAQCLLIGNLEDSGSDKELEPEELEEILSKLRESIQSDIRQATVWNSLGLIFLKTGRVQNAIYVLSSLLVIAPVNLDYLGNLGIAYLQSEPCFGRSSSICYCALSSVRRVILTYNKQI